MVNKDKIKKFIECLVPVTACNLKCHYCYIMQQDRRTNTISEFKYTPEHIAYSLSKKRMGGTCFFSICGAGETLLSKEVVTITHKLLEEGHFVNITTNGTITQRFKELINFPKNLLARLHISFSFHYLELKNKNLLETFFENIKLVRNAGCSILVQCNLNDEYLPFIDDIKNLCLKNTGALPQIALTRDVSSKKIKLFSKYSQKEYFNLGKIFNSPLFEYTNKNFMKKQKKFCYAGIWTFCLNLATGEASQCYAQQPIHNWFENPKEPIKVEAIGYNCKDPYCINSSHFMSLGCIPELKTLSYAQLRDRVCDDGSHWMTDEMLAFLNTKLYDSNKEYNCLEKLLLKFKQAHLLDIIFSIKNQYSGNKKHKVITILGLKIKIRV